MELFELVLNNLSYTDHIKLARVNRAMRAKILAFWPEQIVDHNSKDLKEYSGFIPLRHFSVKDVESISSLTLKCRSRKFNSIRYVSGSYELILSGISVIDNNKISIFKYTGIIDKNIPIGTHTSTVTNSNIKKGFFERDKLVAYTRSKYQNGELNGDTISYYDLKETLIKEITPYQNGHIHGVHKTFHLDQKLDCITYFVKGNIIFVSKDISVSRPRSVFTDVWNMIFS